jgi:RimJ/RimL family protein N-acetyltransferase
VSPIDTSSGAGTASAPEPDTDPGSGPAAETRPVPGSGPAGPDCEDTLDLRLPDQFTALCADEEAGPSGAAGPTTATESAEAPPSPAASAVSDLSVTRLGTPQDDDLLDHVSDWDEVVTSVGVFHLVPVRPERDLALIARWMNDPAVAVFWDLAGDATVAERHLRAQLAGDGRSVPCLGVLDGTPMSYWEIYRADLDPLARYYPARPHDTGLHLLIGGVADRGRGLGSTLLRAVADLVLERRAACARVIAEPDIRNTPSVAAFLNAGFRFSAEVDLPDKRAALMVRDRALQPLLQPDYSP